MITLFVALYSLLRLCTAAETSDIKELHVKTVKSGEDVTMECNISNVKNKDKLVWYRQSFRKVPQYLAKYYKDNKGYRLAEGFNDSRFSITVNDHKFDLNIKYLREDDRGEYFCGEVETDKLKFTSGTRLEFEGEKMNICPTSGTFNKNTDCVTPQSSNSSHVEGDKQWINVLITSNIISVIVIMVLIGVLFKNHRKAALTSNHQISTNQTDDEDVLNYAAVSFAKKPSSSRTSRDTSHQDVYAQVKIK